MPVRADADSQPAWKRGVRRPWLVLLLLALAALVLTAVFAHYALR